jgi:hypothetical protein
MRRSLSLHPDARCEAITRIEVEVSRPRPGVLALTFVLTGAIGELHLPRLGPGARTDELWRRTCFEAFVRPMPGEVYFEFNLAPSGDWATYGFSGYRAGMVSPPGAAAPRITATAGAGRYELAAVLTLDGLPGAPAAADWRLGLAAVIEEAGCRTSHWALTHPPGKADFHHAAGFACELPRPESV